MMPKDDAAPKRTEMDLVESDIERFLRDIDDFEESVGEREDELGLPRSASSRP